MILRTQSRVKVVEYLARQPDYKVTDEKGRAAVNFAEAIGWEGSKTSFPSLLKAMEADGMISRIGSLQELNGGPPVPAAKRCYEVRLLVDNLPDNFRDLIPEMVTIPTDQSGTVAPEEEAPKEEEVETQPEVQVVEKEPDYAVLAVALLNEVGNILNRDDWHFKEQIKQIEARLEEARIKLNQALEENHRLRTKLDIAYDDIKAQKSTIGTLRGQVNMLESRLSREGRENDRIIRTGIAEGVKKEIRRFMEAKPSDKN